MSSKQLTCEVCGKCCNRKSDLTRHLKIHTGEKPFTCNECEKSFIQKSDLVKHLRVHTGEKPFTCNKCRMCFSDKSSLIRHQRSHTGEKPFSYNKCWKHYKNKFFLKIYGRFDDQEKSWYSETEKCVTVCSCSENSKVLVGEKSHISCKCGKNSALEGNSYCQEKNYTCMSYCKFCGEEFKESGCHNQVCQMASGELDDIKNVNLLEDAGKELEEGVSVKDEIDIDEIPFESQVSEGTGKELAEGVSVKDEIDIDEILSESQVSEEFEFILVKSEVESH